MEEKYKWRKPVCDQEFDEAPEDRKRLVWKKGYDNKPDYQLKQVRTQPADLANTILKMANKRSLVAAVLNTTAASDIFTQDIEDIPEFVPAERNEPKRRTHAETAETLGTRSKAPLPAPSGTLSPAQPQAPAEGAAEYVTADQAIELADLCQQAKVNKERFLQKAGVTSFALMPRADYAEAREYFLGKI